MSNITLALPDGLRKRMRKHTEIRWSEVARQAIEEKLRRLETLEEVERIAQKSKLTKRDVEELSSMIKREVSEDLTRKYS